ncbi:hypothetical protein F7725_006076, partial [Dissostichus mawsoni]
MANLIVSFKSYFPDMEEKPAQLDWVRNPFVLSEANREKLSLCHQEKLLDVSSDRGLTMTFENSTLTHEDVQSAPVKSIIEEHLANLIVSFKSYFPDMEEKPAQLDWVRNPFVLSEANREKLSLCHQEKLLDVSSDRGLTMTFENSTLT